MYIHNIIIHMYYMIRYPYLHDCIDYTCNPVIIYISYIILNYVWYPYRTICGVIRVLCTIYCMQVRHVPCIHIGSHLIYNIHHYIYSYMLCYAYIRLYMYLHAYYSRYMCMYVLWCKVVTHGTILRSVSRFFVKFPL